MSDTGLLELQAVINERLKEDPDECIRILEGLVSRFESDQRNAEQRAKELKAQTKAMRDVLDKVSRFVNARRERERQEYEKALATIRKYEGEADE